MRQQKFSGVESGNGKQAICQPVAMRLAYDIFDTFPDPILMFLLSSRTVTRLDTIAGLICSSGRNSYAKRINGISHIEPDLLRES